MSEAARGGTQHESQTWVAHNEIEAAVARALAKEGKVSLQPLHELPPEMQTNNKGQPALCHVVILGEQLATFYERLAEGYANGGPHQPQEWAVFNETIAMSLKRLEDITLVPPEQIPASLQTNNSAQRALFGVIIPGEQIATAYRRIAAAYAA